VIIDHCQLIMDTSMICDEQLQHHLTEINMNGEI